MALCVIIPRSMKLETALPDRPDLITNGNVSGLFVQSIVRWRSEMEAVFNPKTNEHASWPATDPRALFEEFAKRPKLAIEMSLELSTIILEIEQAEGLFLDKQTYAHQLGQLKWLALSLLEGGTSYMIEGAPGSGKTLILGAIMMAATRLQMRGLMDSAIVYGTHRPYILAQQTFSGSDRRMRLMKEPTIHDVRQEVECCIKILGPGAAEFFHQKMWQELRKKRYHNKEEAIEAISLVIRERSGGKKFLQSKKDLLTEVARFLTIEAVVLYDIDDSVMIVPLSPAPVTDDDNVMSYGGDIGGGIPPHYLKDGFVAARKGADVDGNAIEQPKKGVPVHSLDSVRVLLTTAPSVAMRTYRRSIVDILRRTGIVIVDEGREPATRFQDAVIEESAEGTTEPLVFIASALSTTNGLGSRPYADRYSPRLTIPEAMEPGPDGKQVLPNVGVDMFPGNGSALYPSETAEALQQLVQAHFAELPLPQKIELPQPHLATSLIVVSNDSIAEAILLLRQEYAKRGIAADVIPFRSCVEKTGDGNNKPPYSERVLQAMMDDCVSEDGTKRIRVMVASPDTVKDALSIPTLQNVTIGTAKGISKTVLLRIFGRLQHSNRHRGAGPAYRGYFRQGLYQNTKIDETIFQLLAEQEGDSVRWTPLQILKGDAGAKADTERVEGLPTMTIPLSTKGLQQRTQQRGMAVKQMALQRAHAAAAAAIKPRNTVLAEIATSSEWEKLERVAGRAKGYLADKTIWLAFVDIVLESLRKIAPTFMTTHEMWPAWAHEFTITMAASKDEGLDVVINAARSRLIAAARLGKVEQEISVEIQPIDELPDDPPETEAEISAEPEVKLEEEIEPDLDDQAVEAEVESLEEGLEFLAGEDDEEANFDPEGDTGDYDDYGFDE